MRVVTLFASILLLFSSCQKRSEQTESVTPGNPLIASQHWESMSAEGWLPSQKVEFTYDENDLLIEETTYAIEGDNMTPSFRTVKSYDEGGSMIRSIRERWINNQWIFGKRSAFIYNAGKIIQRIDSVAGSNAPITFISYRYDEKGRLENELGLRSVEGNMVNQSKINYSYDDRDLLVEKEFPRYSEDSWINARKMTLVYNENGHHIQTIRHNWTDDQWVADINYILQVDSSGTRISELWKRPGENGLEESTRVTYSYKSD